MAKKEIPMNRLQQFLPPGAYETVHYYLQLHKVHLTIARERKTVLGDYRHRTGYSNHRISVNGNMNPYAFLITLLHELAHLLVYELHGNKVQMHGMEWKKIYGLLLGEFIRKKIFPADVESELLLSLKNPAASSCAEDGLIRVLRKYDEGKNGCRLIEELPPHSLFRIGNGAIFKRGEKQRKRYKCTEVKTGKIYLFSPVYEVEMIEG